MKKRRPGKGAALGNKRLESGIGARNLAAGFSARNPIVPKPWSAWRDPEIDAETRAGMVRLWWQLRRHRVEMPAERGVIQIDGGQR